MALGNGEGEIELTYDAFPGSRFLVNGLSATVFRSGDLLTIEDQEGVLILRFEVGAGERFWVISRREIALRNGSIQAMIALPLIVTC